MRNIKTILIYWEECNGDLIERFKNLYKTGNLDILTCAATHGYLPILRENLKQY